MSAVVEQELERLLKAFGRIRLSVNFVELFTTLIFTGRMDAKMVSTTLPIPPKATVTVTSKIPLDKVALCSELRLSFDRDHALQIFVSIDNRLVAEDYDAVMDNYREPTNFFRLGATLPIKDNTTTVIKNKTDYLVRLSFMRMCALIDKSLFTTIIERYFRTLLSELGG